MSSKPWDIMVTVIVGHNGCSGPLKMESVVPPNNNQKWISHFVKKNKDQWPPPRPELWDKQSWDIMGEPFPQKTGSAAHPTVSNNESAILLKKRAVTGPNTVKNCGTSNKTRVVFPSKRDSAIPSRIERQARTGHPPCPELRENRERVIHPVQN